MRTVRQTREWSKRVNGLLLLLWTSAFNVWSERAAVTEVHMKNKIWDNTLAKKGMKSKWFHRRALNRRFFGIQRSVDFLALVLYDFTRVVLGKAFLNGKNLYLPMKKQKTSLRFHLINSKFMLFKEVMQSNLREFIHFWNIGVLSSQFCMGLALKTPHSNEDRSGYGCQCYKEIHSFCKIIKVI